MRTIRRDIVGAIIYSGDGKILLGLHGPHGTYKDCWVTPGGGVDAGETRLQALRRELLEEIGLDIAGYEVTPLDHEASDRHEKLLAETGERVLADMHFYNYEIRIDKPSIELRMMPNEDLVQLEWVPKPALKQKRFPQVSVELFKSQGLL